MAGKIIVFAGDKGGPGKTTTCASLGVSLSSMGFKVAFVETDQKLGIGHWFNYRQSLIDNLKNNVESFSVKNARTGRSMISNTNLKHLLNIEIPPLHLEKMHGRIFRGLLSLASEFDFVLVDTHGGFTIELTDAMTVADLVIVPFKPSMPDLETADETDMALEKAKIQNHKLQSVSLINEALSYNQSELLDVKEYLNGFENLKTLSVMVKQLNSFRTTYSLGLGVTEWTDSNSKAQFSLITQEVLELLGVTK